MLRLVSLAVVVTLSCVSAVDPAARVCVQGGPVPPECPNNNRWNSVTCQFECLPTPADRICIQGGPVPAECPNNNRWNPVTCRFECVPAVDASARVCIQGGPVPPECPDNNRWNSVTCRFECVPQPKCVDSGKKYDLGLMITRGCKTGTCTKNAAGQAVWSWYDPSTVTNKPLCPYGYGIWNSNTCKWDCPRTCKDGSTPPKCLQQPSPCSVVRCGFNTVCVDNFCNNFPAPGSGKCTAQCVTPVQCTKDPCQSPPGQPKCGKNQVCEADYSVGCNYRCNDAPTCEFNGQTFQLNESRPSEDGCNTCSCSENGWVCTLKACPAPTKKPICVQGGPVPAECPNNNRWNSVTCKFECVCPQNQNCGINGVWDYDNCRCVVNTPRPTERPICVQGGPVPPECPDNNQWNPQTCQFECLPHCVTNEGKFVFGGDRFYTKCNGCTCNAEGSAACTRIGCDDAKCYDDAGRAYARGATITRGCKTATCVKDSNQQSVWKWVDPEAQQPPRCNLGPATFNKATCKWSCPKKCADGLSPPQCLVNPCATILCAANSQCVVNQCANYPNTENGPCTASCQPIVNCLVSPCSVNSCGKGQTCVDDYVGGCNYRCKEKFPL